MQKINDYRQYDLWDKKYKKCWKISECWLFYSAFYTCLRHHTSSWRGASSQTQEETIDSAPQPMFDNVVVFSAYAILSSSSSSHAPSSVFSLQQNCNDSGGRVVDSECSSPRGDANFSPGRSWAVEPNHHPDYHFDNPQFSSSGLAFHAKQIFPERPACVI